MIVRGTDLSSGQSVEALDTLEWRFPLVCTAESCTGEVEVTFDVPPETAPFVVDVTWYARVGISDWDDEADLEGEISVSPPL